MRIKKENIMQYVPTGKTYTVDLYTFDELDEAAKEYAVDEFVGSNEDMFSWEFQDFVEPEIWECVRDLEKNISGARVSWRYNRFYSCDFDIEYSYDDCFDPDELDAVKDTGYYASFDLCDVWNKHLHKLNGLCHKMNYIDHLSYDIYPYWDHYETIRENVEFNNRLDGMRDKVVSMWYEELEAACEDVANTIQSLLVNEWEYVTSREYAAQYFHDVEAGYESRMIDNSGRVYYSDSRKWFTVDGELYEEANINHACVSIVKTS